MSQTIQKENTAFFDAWAKSYDCFLFQFWMKHFHQGVLKVLDFSKPFTLLDVSCGTGELLNTIAKKSPKCKLSGMDFSQEMISSAQRKNKNIYFQQGDVHKLSFKDNTFDYVISTTAFHHYHDQQKAMQEMTRVAKKGGSIIVSDIHFLLRLFNFLNEKLEPGCVHVNSGKEMKSLFEKVGLINIQQKRNFMFSMITLGIKN